MSYSGSIRKISHRVFIVIFFLTLLIPSVSFARKKKKVDDETKKVAEIHAVERGRFMFGDVGPVMLLSVPAVTGLSAQVNSSSAVGNRVSFGYGADLGSLVSIGVGLNHWFVGFIDDRTGEKLDMSSLEPFAKLYFSLFGKTRFLTSAFVEGGYALPMGSVTMELAGPRVGGGLVFEYYTALRHFSIGLGLSGNYFLTGGNIGAHVSPTLKYTF